MLAIGILMKFVAVLFVIVAVVLILVILVQKGRGGGLSAAFGGGVAGGLLGSKTGDFLTWVTIVLVAVFLTLAVVLARFYRPQMGEYGSDQAIETQQPTSTSPPPAGDAGSPAADGAMVPPEPVQAEAAVPEDPQPGATVPGDANAAGG